MSDITFVTSFNKRLFESKFQGIWNSVKETHPEHDFIAYHENEYESSKFGRHITFPESWPNCTTVDLFQVTPWLAEFVETFPYAPADNYWNHHAKYWFRKVATLAHCVKNIDTKYLIWMDCDIYFRRKIGADLLAWFDQHDICCIKRRRLHTETGFIVFNVERTGAFIEELQRKYTSLEFVKEPRWDDCYMFDLCVKKFPSLKVGGLGPQNGCPLSVPKELIWHHKGPFAKIRANEH